MIPPNLRVLARAPREIEVEVEGTPTQKTVLDAVEAAYPSLRGTIRDRDTLRRRPLVRFYACKEDLSDEDIDTPLPAEVAEGKEPFLVVGAMAGG